MPTMSYENNSIFWVEVDRISPNPYQPRKEFDETRLKELADSIRMYGILQPLTVTRVEHEHEDGGISVQYELIAGERRLRAAKLSGLEQVPVIIRIGEESEREKLELAIIENLQREDLNPVDRAFAFEQLKKEFKLTDKQIAAKVGRSRVYVANTLRLLKLPEHILNALRDQKISEGHGRSLLMLIDRPQEQETLFRETLLKKLSVRDVERISRKIAIEKVRKKDWGIEPELLELERQLTESLGTRVQIEKKDFGGRLVIDYFAAEDIRRILEMLERHEATGAPERAVAEAKQLEDLGNTTPLSPDVPELDANHDVPNNDAPDPDAIHTSTSPEIHPDRDIASNPNSNINPDTETETDLNIHAETTKEEKPEDDSVPGDASMPDTEELVGQPAESAETEKPAAPADADPTDNESEDSKKGKDDSDLYSIKNFSL